MSKLIITIQNYLNKFSSPTKLIKSVANPDCRQIIVIPAYCEPELEKTLQSLCECHPPRFMTEIFIVLNCAEGDEKAEAFHLHQMRELGKKFSRVGNLHFCFIDVGGLPPRHAGVGIARKIGMDEAVKRFLEIETDGMIVCLDGDCMVSKNYLQELEKLALQPEKYNCVCLNFEHDFLDTPIDLSQGIIYYELFLRYYKESLRLSGFPFAFHTIGSSMAVKTSAYCKAGGMNRRKAGEDFYFLHKIFPYGDVVELNEVVVYPSSRISERVPFGTGRAQKNFIDEKPDNYLTYNFRIFEELSALLQHDFSSDTNFDSLPLSVIQFLRQNDFESKLEEIRSNTASGEQFKKRWNTWLDGFMILKYVHYARDNYYPNEPIELGLSHLFQKMKLDSFSGFNHALLELRRFQKNPN